MTSTPRIYYLCYPQGMFGEYLSHYISNNNNEEFQPTETIAGNKQNRYGYAEVELKNIYKTLFQTDKTINGLVSIGHYPNSSVYKPIDRRDWIRLRDILKTKNSILPTHYYYPERLAREPIYQYILPVKLYCTAEQVMYPFLCGIMKIWLCRSKPVVYELAKELGIENEYVLVLQRYMIEAGFYTNNNLEKNIKDFLLFAFKLYFRAATHGQFERNRHRDWHYVNPINLLQNDKQTLDQFSKIFNLKQNDTAALTNYHNNNLKLIKQLFKITPNDFNNIPKCLDILYNTFINFAYAHFKPL